MSFTNSPEDYAIQVEQARNGQMTASIQMNGRRQYLHSRYDPEREALALLEKEAASIEGQPCLVIFGIGIGYFVKHILERYPTKKLYLFEPEERMLKALSAHHVFSPRKCPQIRAIQGGQEALTMNEFVNTVLRDSHGYFSFLASSGIPKLFPQPYQALQNRLREAVNRKRQDVQVVQHYRTRWMINSIRNIPHIMSTPNIMEQQGAFPNIPALIVAAGPSLMDDLEVIRQIKTEKKAYIFAAGSANRTLLHYGIRPDAVVSYDPQGSNYNVFNQVRQQGITDIPLLFGTSVGYETPDLFPGPKAHFWVNQDFTSPWFFKPEKPSLRAKMPVINDAPSVTIVTLQLLYHLGFSPIILTGQNLAYLNDKVYADTAIGEARSKELQAIGDVEVESVDGEMLTTNRGLLTMKTNLEIAIQGMPGLDLINTTRRGAAIKGTQYQPMEKLLETTLYKSEVATRPLLPDNHEPYLANHFQERLEKLKREKRKFQEALEEMERILSRIHELITTSSSDMSLLQALLPRIDQWLNKMDTNVYNEICLFPAIRVHHEAFARRLDHIAGLSQPEEKFRQIHDDFGHYLTALKKAHEEIAPHIAIVEEELEPALLKLLSFTVMFDQSKDVTPI
ncbi:motility associated factor glycosyltransferase family protein [Anoxynatronum sibiricum]|uniref:6-hydroxymethylpterin diphosphokinase MptE-like protein n=1 Tax=Anoxynatronum sibiricum TaxID=210623 RepID=A0ABU9VUG0_9CLOT